jgi:XTP/dITP diphosphohydrolase
MNKDLGRLIVASHNAGKVREIEALLAPLGVEVASAAALGLPEPEETEATFEGNALLKARAAAFAAGCAALADDSGLSVDALGGDPGIYSARWAGPTKDFGLAMDKVWTALQGAPSMDPTARFVCVLALAWPDGREHTFRGEVEGVLAWPPRGERGFGYDPMFMPHGHGETFGEMDPALKQELSHRARAFEKFKAWLEA